MTVTPFAHIHQDNDKVALVEGDASYSYGELSQTIHHFASGLLGDKTDLNEERIAFFMPASLDYVSALHGIWRAGGIAVPLNVASAVTELDHYLKSAGVTRLVANGEYAKNIKPLCAQLNIELLSSQQLLSTKQVPLPEISQSRRAMMLFTSGTTNKPKGVVSTHKNIQAQITTLIDAWAWTEQDSIPLFLPLHHIHGIINVLSCGLWAGATVHLFAKFDVQAICEQVALGRYNVFMAVPTVYVKVIQYLDTLEQEAVDNICRGFNDMRLNISGSAACPVKLFNQWRDLTGQVLLERYGMTEIGMGISNPYDGLRRAGHVGKPLPGVTAALFDDQDKLIKAENTPGEIRIKGDNVFLEYWHNPEATAKSFKNGWFCTGDVAVIDKGDYRIMGRSSIDIIKSGGYKLSALEIEGVLLTHEQIAEVAVIGVPDDTWGEAVMAFIVLKPQQQMHYEDLKRWCAEKMSSYKVPKDIRVVDALPRNAMGKVTKPALKALL